MTEPLAMKGRTPKTDTHRRSCAICGQGDHRYGTTDSEHKYDAMGCVNMLIPLLREIVESIDGCDLSFVDEERLAPLVERATEAWRYS